MSKLSGGSTANLVGSSFQMLVRAEMEQSLHLPVEVDFKPPNQRTIYGRKRSIDLFLRGLPHFPMGLGIKCSQQNQRGTGAYKVPYWIAEIADWSFPAILILDGNGYTVEGAGAWAVRQVDYVPNLQAVLDLNGFRLWLDAMRNQQGIVRTPISKPPVPRNSQRSLSDLWAEEVGV